MSRSEVLPELKQIVGAMLFAARKPLTVADMRRVLKQVGEDRGGPARDFAQVGERQIQDAVAELGRDLASVRSGMTISEISKGYRLENEVGCGMWVRQLLEKGKPARLSRPALETLAVIAYRQPVTRAQIEAVRGVAVDQIVRNLLDLQLVRVAGRSSLPGRPWLFGTTQTFLEHFGLRQLDDLPGVDELRTLVDAQVSQAETAGIEAEAPAAKEEDDVEEPAEAGASGGDAKGEGGHES